MSGIKNYLDRIEEYVIEAYSEGARNEEDIVAYVKTQMEANEKDVHVIAKDFFDFVRDEICS